jgi:hypothetical protein
MPLCSKLAWWGCFVGRKEAWAASVWGRQVGLARPYGAYGTLFIFARPVGFSKWTVLISRARALLGIHFHRRIVAARLP